MFVIIIFFGIVMILGIMGINIYNRFIFYRDIVLDKFVEVDKLLCNRVDYIDKIIDIINKNKFHEDGIVRDLNNLKNSINKEIDINERIKLVNDDIIDKALGLNSVYDKLNKDKNFNNLKEEYDNNKGLIDYAIDIYNEEVFKYNNYKNRKINNMIFKWFKFYEYNCYMK